jgi:hypothetical protein
MTEAAVATQPDNASAAATPAAPAPAVAAPVAAAAPAVDAKADFEKQWAEFKPPEGLDKEALKEVVAFARQAGIDPKAAAAIALRDKARADKEAAEFKHMAEKGWLEELQKDPELGGEKSRETMVTAMRAHDKLPPKVQAMIKEQGLLYNPIVVRLLHAFGNGLKEDSFVRPGASPAPEQKKSLDERLQGLWTK